MHKHIVWGTIGLVAGVLLGIFATATTPNMGIEEKMSQSTSRESFHDVMRDTALEMKELEGTEFEKAFLETMIEHHEGAIDLARLVLQKSDRPEFRTMAENIITVQTAEIMTMEGWLREWIE